MRKLLSFLLGILFVGLLLLPVAGIFRLADLEKADYSESSDVTLRNLAYGEPLEAFRMDMEQTTMISGEVISTGVVFMEIGKYYSDYSSLQPRFIVEAGDYIEEEQIIAYYKEEPICSEVTGILREINTGTQGYLLFEDLESLSLCISCRDSVQLKLLCNESTVFTDKNGNTYAFDHAESRVNADGATNVYLTCVQGTLIYGSRMEDMTLKTGRVFPQVLVVPENCVYSYPQEEKTYVRLVTAEGEFREEVEVTCGYSDGTYICVEGIEEGDLCDSGYKLAVESGVLQ